MRQHDQQINDEEPGVVRSDPVPVPTPDRDAAPAGTDGRHPEDADLERDPSHQPVPEDALDDRGSFDNPTVSGADRDRTGATDPDQEGDGDPDRPRFHEPAPQPTTFGAATAGGAVAAAALAGGPRSTEHDVDEVDADRTEDGAAEDGSGRVRDAAHRNAAGTPVAGVDLTGDTAGTDATASDTTAPATELLPGDVPAEPVSILLAADAAADFRDRWRDVQLRFVDDPRGAVDEAQRLVDEAVGSLTAALTAQQDRLGSWRSGGSPDTEELRVAVRRYRDFLDRLLGM